MSEVAWLVMWKSVWIGCVEISRSEVKVTDAFLSIILQAASTQSGTSKAAVRKGISRCWCMCNVALIW